jgi:hypothetical protein
MRRPWPKSHQGRFDALRPLKITAKVRTGNIESIKSSEIGQLFVLPCLAAVIVVVVSAMAERVE